MGERDRSAWPVQIRRLHAPASDDLSSTTTPLERLHMMWPLALEAWKLAGRALPDYTRADMPSRLYRPGDRRDEE